MDSTNSKCSICLDDFQPGFRATRSRWLFVREFRMDISGPVERLMPGRARNSVFFTGIM